MKRFAFVLMAVSLSSTAVAQPDTVLGDEVTHGFYFAPVAKLTEIDNDFSVLAGGHGGWIINNQFVVGLGGYGLVHPERHRELGYGGLLLGAMAAPDSVVHIGARVLVGAGHEEPRCCHPGVPCDGGDWDWSDVADWGWGSDCGWDDWDRAHDDDPHGRHRRDDGDTFFVVEPELLVRINFAKPVRLTFAGGYRFVDGSRRDSALSGYTISFAVEIGKFQ